MWVTEPDTDSRRGRVRHQKVDFCLQHYFTVMRWKGRSCGDIRVWNLCLVLWWVSLVKWQKSAVMLSRCDVQTYLLDILPRSRTWPRWALIRLCASNNASIVASRNHVSNVEFPTSARFSTGRRWGKLSFSIINDTRSAMQTTLPLLLGWWSEPCSTMQGHCHGCKAERTKWWKGALL